MQLSTFKRNEILDDVNGEHFDIIIIGGGITGAGIALDAASRGMKVLLLEKYDFASGTSSKSTKLIHGGLRYLKQMEFALVRKVGTERAVIHNLAPHLVVPINMLLPIYKKGSLGKYTTSLALWIYDFLAKVKKEDQYKMLGPKATKEIETLLNDEELIGGALYKEYRTDDARLTIEILKTAGSYGAICLNYAKAEEFIYSEEKISGIKFRDLISNKVFSSSAHKIINAAGPWVDDVRKLDETIRGKQLHLTKGIHLVLAAQRLPISNAVYFDVDGDNRMIFAIPRNNKIYIGTTDTNYEGDKDNIGITKEDVGYLLNAVNQKFPSAKLITEDIESSWAGLRPLIHEEGKSPSELSRKDEIFISQNGLISIAGGKLTGYRKMAEKVVDLLAADLKKNNNLSFKKSDTSKIKINGSDFNSDISTYTERRTGEAKQIGLSYDDIKYLVNNYGTATEWIIEKAFELHGKIADARERILYAEILYCAEEEMITSLSDFLIRRTGRLYFDKSGVIKEYKLIEHLIEKILSTDPLTAQEQLMFFEYQLQSAAEFK